MQGKKCKYSHDLTLDRGEELDLYVDQRTQLIMNEYKQEDMATWDEEKLMSVIREKEKAYLKQLEVLYEEWFQEYDLSPTLIVETDRIDYIEHLFDRLELVRAVKEHIGPVAASGRERDPT